MSSLADDSFLRAERQRRHQLNRLIVDQHVRSNDTIKESPAYLLHPPPYTKPTKYNDPNYQQQYHLPSLKGNNSSNMEGISDRTDVYLSNCEEIIRNLRELKNRKQKGSTPPIEKYEPPQREQVSRYVAPYYPKSSFSSSGSPYNKQVEGETPSKSFKIRGTRMKTLEDTHQSRRSAQLPTKSSYKNLQENQQKYDEEEPEEEYSPKLKSILIKSNPKQDAEREKRQKRQKAERQKKQLEQKKQRQENRKHQLELSKCLSQLTKYLQTQNKQKPASKASNYRQSIEDDQQEEELQKNNPTTIKTLKMKALLALRSINEKSQSFRNKMAETRKSNERMPTTEEPETQRAKTKYKDSRVTFMKDPVIEKAKDKPKQKEISTKSDKKENEQLVKLLVGHLDRQEGHNEELTHCLKELTEYLRNQNIEIEQLRNNNSKLQEKTAQKDKDASKKKSNTTKDNKTPEKEETAKLQEAILKRLKKARMRGNLFKEKVETFRKEHHMTTQTSKKGPAKNEPAPKTVQTPTTNQPDTAGTQPPAK